MLVKKSNNIISLSILLMLMFSCIRNEYNIDDLSLNTEFELDLAVPVVKGSFHLEDFINNNADSLLTIDNDTIFAFFKQENVFSIKSKDLMPAIEQGASMYTIQTDYDISITGIDTINLTELKQETFYPITDEKDMIIDSLYVREGSMDILINNRYSHDVIMELYSPSLFKKTDGTNYREQAFVAANENIRLNIDFSEYKIETYLNEESETCVKIQFSPILINSGSDVIRKEEGIDIEFKINEIKSIDLLFGNLGQQTRREKSKFSLIDDFPFKDNLSGSFNLSDPRITFIYHQSFGIPVSFEMNILSYTGMDEPVEIKPDPQTIWYSEDYLNPDYTDTIILTKRNTTHIDQLISFPMADSLVLFADVVTNPLQYSDSFLNYIYYNSSLSFDLRVDFPLKFNASLTYADTVSNSLYEEEEIDASLNYLNIHYVFNNTFPLAFYADIILYDSLSDITLETIPLNSGSSPFIEAALVDNGEVTGAKKTEGLVNVSGQAVQQIFNDATHFIIRSTIQSSNNTSTLIRPDSNLDFKIGLDVSGRVTTNLNSGDDE
jgi:hypothetical protein